MLADELLRGPDEAGRGHHGHGGQLAGDLPQPRHQPPVSLGRSVAGGGDTAAAHLAGQPPQQRGQAAQRQELVPARLLLRLQAGSVT